MLAAGQTLHVKYWAGKNETRIIKLNNEEKKRSIPIIALETVGRAVYNDEDARNKAKRPKVKKQMTDKASNTIVSCQVCCVMRIGGCRALGTAEDVCRKRGSLS